MRMTPKWRLRLIRRDAGRCATAIENLRIGLIKIAARANALNNMSAASSGDVKALYEASRLLGLALGELDLLNEKGGN